MLKEPTCSERGCKHFLGLKRHDGPETEDQVICRAFPDGIPDEIAYGDNPDTLPFPRRPRHSLRGRGKERGGVARPHLPDEIALAANQGGHKPRVDSRRASFTT